MILSKKMLAACSADGIRMPSAACFGLSEKVLQFGTGVLLRGLPDYFIDKANKAGIFGGRIVVVKSTAQGGTDEFARQDCLYTHYIRGVHNGQAAEETVINASISRVLHAGSEWAEILACAKNEAMQVVISNTTEVGLALLPGDRIGEFPPQSFPGKLLAFLHARFQAFGGAPDKGMVIIPTELIPENGNRLRDICLTLAKSNGLGDAFMNWLTEANDFCNSLVDCIVPGALPEAEAARLDAINGYTDALHISSESFRLWVIETQRESTRRVLSFAAADEGVIVTGNIEKFREIKLRLLNAPHTFTCGLAVLSGFSTVKEAMANTFFSGFVSALMMEEIIPAIVGTGGITRDEATAFANRVLDRFRNPHIEHQWLSICAQYSSKMAMRCVPVLLEFYRRKRLVPQHMAAGFGAYVLFMRCGEVNGQFSGRALGTQYGIQDEKAALLCGHWQGNTPEQAVHRILSDQRIWGADLAQLPGFERAVMQTVRKFLEQTAGAELPQADLLAV